MSQLEIHKMLVLSTGHVTEETAKKISGDREGSIDWGPTFTRDEGWVF